MLDEKITTLANRLNKAVEDDPSTIRVAVYARLAKSHTGGGTAQQLITCREALAATQLLHDPATDTFFDNGQRGGARGPQPELDRLIAVQQTSGRYQLVVIDTPEAFGFYHSLRVAAAERVLAAGLPVVLAGLLRDVPGVRRSA